MKTTDQTLSDQQLFLLAHRRHHHFVHFARIFMLLLFLTVWELFADFHIIDSFFFSSPSRVVACFVRMVSERSLFTHIGITLTETVISFFLVALVSLSAATLLWYSRRLSEILEPFLVVLNSLPKSALAPLLIVWLGTGMDTIIAAGISVAIFGATINLYTGFLQADPEKLLLIRTLGGTRRDCFFKVVLPASIPVILSNMKVNIGLCLVGVIIGEFIGGREGLGYMIIYGSQVFKLDWLLMSICILCVIAMLLYALIGLIEKWYLCRCKIS